MLQKINAPINNPYVFFTTIKTSQKKFMSTKKNTHRSIPILVRNGDYEIIDECSSINSARKKHGKNVSKATFAESLKNGRFIKKAEIFIEYNRSKKRNSDFSKDIEEGIKALEKSPQLTGRYRITKCETNEIIGVFSSLNHATKNFNGRVSARSLYLILDDPLSKSNKFNIRIELEYRDFINHTLIYRIKNVEKRIRTRCINTNKNLAQTGSIIVRDENYKIIDHCGSYSEAREKYGNGASLDTFRRSLKSGKFIKRANIFIECNLSETKMDSSKQVEELKKSVQFTGRFKLTNSKTNQIIGIFSNVNQASKHFDSKISTAVLHKILRNPLNLNNHNIQVEFEYRDFINNTLYYKKNKTKI